ncbi:MAG: hypothetical protein MJ237_07805 [bacterium]|nr:hypothetical protein [bacterium]
MSNTFGNVIETCFANPMLRNLAKQADSCGDKNGTLNGQAEMHKFKELVHNNKSALEKQGVFAYANEKNTKDTRCPDGKEINSIHVTQKLGDYTIDIDCHQTGLMGNITAKDKNGNKVQIDTLAKIFNLSSRYNFIERLMGYKQEYVNKNTGVIFTDKNDDNSLDYVGCFIE